MASAHSSEPSLLRLYLMRVVFLLNLVMLGMDVWPALISKGGSFDPVKGVAYSFWATLSLLSLLGLRYPLKMLPLLLFQFVYKLIWLLAVAVPQWSTIQAPGLMKAMIIGLVVDLAVIPWPYVVAAYLRAPGNRWKSHSPQQSVP